MIEKSTIQEIELLIEGLRDLVPDDTITALQALVRAVTLATLRADTVSKELSELKAALRMYEANAGEASIMFSQNLQLCLDQIRMGKS